MFLIYVNDLIDGIGSYASLFADDMKIMKRIERREDCMMLQDYLNKIFEWSQCWEMDFNTRKRRVLIIDRSTKRIEAVLQGTSDEKDLGVIVQDDLSPRKHISNVVGGTYRLITKIKTAFIYMDEEMLRKLIVSMIGPQLEYAALV